MQKCPNEHELIGLVRQGDKSAFKELFEAYQLPVYNFLLRMLGAAHDAEDVTQEVFVKVYRKVASLNDVTHFSSWLFRIAKNEALNFAQRRRPRNTDSFQDDPDRLDRQLASENPEAQPSPHKQVESDELQTLLQTALDELPETMRITFVLGVLEGYSYREVAEVMRCSVGNVKARVFRARSLLSQQLRPLLDE